MESYMRYKYSGKSNETKADIVISRRQTSILVAVKNYKHNQ